MASAGLDGFPMRMQENRSWGGVLEVKATLAEKVCSSGKWGWWGRTPVLGSMVAYLGSTERCWDLSGGKLQVIRIEDRPAQGSRRPRRKSPVSLKAGPGTDITSLRLYSIGQCSHGFLMGRVSKNSWLSLFSHSCYNKILHSALSLRPPPPPPRPLPVPNLAVICLKLKLLPLISVSKLPARSLPPSNVYPPLPCPPPQSLCWPLSQGHLDPLLLLTPSQMILPLPFPK